MQNARADKVEDACDKDSGSPYKIKNGNDLDKLHEDFKTGK